MMPVKRNLNHLTIAELKELLRERNLSVSGSKTELIARLIAAEPEIEDALHQQFESEQLQTVQGAIPVSVEGPRDETSSAAGVSASATEREMEFLRRERDLN